MRKVLLTPTKSQTPNARQQTTSRHLAQLEGEGQPPEPPSRTKKGSTQGSGTECPLLTMTTGKSCGQWIRWYDKRKVVRQTVFVWTGLRQCHYSCRDKNVETGVRTVFEQCLD